MENYLASYRHLIKELDTAMSQNNNNKLKIKFSETPERFVFEKNGVKISDIDRPAYGLLTQMLQYEAKKLRLATQKYRTLVYSFIYEIDVDYSFEKITETHKDIESIKHRIAMLEALRDKGNSHILLREPNVNTQKTQIIKKIENAKSIDKKPVSKPPKMGKISKESLKNTLLTGKVSESDLKVFLFKTLKECSARPNANNNALSKDKLIEKMLENPNLKKRLPPSYANKKKRGTL